jgi:outer membrane receptor for ferrienterochelin and colicin
MNRQFRVKRLAGALAVLLAASSVHAQNTSANLAGRITATDGSPLTGADVTIVHTPSGTTSRATTDADGRYNARGLRVGGPYTVTVQKVGYQGEASQNVFLLLGETSSVNVDLDPASTTSLDAVEVVAAAGVSVFSAESMGAGTSVSRQEIESLPSINGNIQDYMRLDPRVAFTDRASGSISAGGQNPRFNKITIDGVSASDTFGLEGNNLPTQRQPASMETIEAIDVSLSNYDVIYAGAAGANVNAVTKSGTNEFHGSVYGYVRDGEWFGEHPLTGAEFTEFEDEQTYGATFGGPIFTDRLFFFANYEKFTRAKPTPDLSSTPLGNGGDFDAADVAEVQRISQLYGFDAGGLTGNGDTELEEKAIKLDWNISEDHRANFRYSDLEQARVRPEGSTASALALSSNWYNHVKTVESYVGQIFSDWSDNFSTEFKASYRDYSAIRVNPTNAPTIQIYFDDGNNANQITAGDFIRLGTERSSGGNALTTETWNYFGAATWTVGDHDIKFGAEYSDNEIYNFFLQDAYGNYSFYGLENYARGEYFDYDVSLETSPGSIPAEFATENLGFFLQDTWYATSNLTVSLGVRADRPETDPQPTFNACFATPRVGNNTGPASCPNGGFGLDNSNTYKDDFIIQPRFGFNYTFDWDRPTQLRGGLGLFQGDAPNVWVSNSYQSTGLNFISYQNITNFAGVPFTADGLNPSVPPAGTAVRNVNVIAEDFELPSVWKANLAFDHELPWWGVVATAELLVTEVENALFYRTLNIGAGYLGPDGRALFWNPAAPNFLSTNNNRFGRNAFFGDVFLLENSSKGRSQQLTLMLQKPFTAESEFSWSAGYTYTNADEVGALTSSTAGSGFGSQYNFSTNEELSNTARYEIKNRFTGSLNWRHSFFGDYATSAGLFYEGRSGRPFSYIFTGDANGDSRTFNDLFYVPSGRGDVLFGTISNAGAFTANPQAENDFFNWLEGRPDLQAYAGQYAPENGFRAGWVNTFDLRFSQELPGFFKEHRSEIWLDVQNVGNLINEDWGHVLDYGFNANQAVASLVGIHDGRYVYNYRAGTEFGQSTALVVPTDADGQSNGVSQWSLQVGFRYKF